MKSVTLVSPALALAAALAAACSREPSSTPVQTPVKQDANARVTLGPLGRTADDQLVEVIKLRNSTGIEIEVITYGGIITKLRTPDRSGQLDDIVLGFDDFAPYETKSPYFGCLIGRYGNRRRRLRRDSGCGPEADARTACKSRGKSRCRAESFFARTPACARRGRHA